MQAFHELYERSFPKNEKFSFYALARRYRKGDVEFLSIVEDGAFAGLMIMAENDGSCLLNYFAVNERSRGRGYGGQALALLKERIGGNDLFLDIELVSTDAKNVEQRERRKAFYVRNGFLETGLRFALFGDKFEILSTGADMDMAMLHAMLGRIYGKMAGCILKIVLKPLK